MLSSYKADIRAMLRIAIPLALAELGWMFMSVVDTVMVGGLRNSAVAIGAASVGSALYYVFAIFGTGLMSGLDTLVSQAFGAGRPADGWRSLGSGLLLAALAAPLLCAAVLLSIPALAAMKVNSEVRVEAEKFVRVLVWSLPLLLFYSVFRRYLQGLHDVRPVTFALITANLVNVAGNWVLIYGHLGMPAMGVPGSALSTVIARFYLVIVLFAAVALRDPAALRGMRADMARLRELFRLGLPAGITIALEVGVFNTSSLVIGKLDPESLAAHTITLNAAAVSYMVPLGIASAAAVMVGREVGAGIPAGAKRAGWTAVGLGLVWALIAATGFVLFSGPITRVYTQDAGVARVAATLFTIAALFQICDGLQTITTGALRGKGDTTTAMVWNLVCYWVIGFPIGYWLCFGFGWGAAGIWTGLCLALTLIGIGLTIRWHNLTKIANHT
jgi:MATE family multidrug resistance protein